MILVTGATGGLGGAVIDNLFQLITRDQIAGLVRKPEKAGALTLKGIAARIGDYANFESMVSAFRGIDKVLLVSTIAFTDGFAHHSQVIDAAKKAGVKHLVFTSIQRSNKSSYLIPWVTENIDKTEKYLAASGMDFTIVRNTFYSDNLPYWIGNHWETDGIKIPAGNGRVPYATRADLAEAISRILVEPIHAGKTYTLTNLETYSFADIANKLSGLTGREVTFYDVPAPHFVNRIEKAGYPKPLAVFWSQWAEAFKDGYMNEVDASLETLLKRKPVDVGQFLMEQFSKNAVSALSNI